MKMKTISSVILSGLMMASTVVLAHEAENQVPVKVVIEGKDGLKHSFVTKMHKDKAEKFKKAGGVEAKVDVHIGGLDIDVD